MADLAQSSNQHCLFDESEPLPIKMTVTDMVSGSKKFSWNLAGDIALLTAYESACPYMAEGQAPKRAAWQAVIEGTQGAFTSEGHV